MRADRSVDEFIDSNYAFFNSTLAGYYFDGALGITGNEMRKVDLGPGNWRGGILTLGSVLMVTSNPTRTSPVKRGKWILENILDAPAPPPPPNIPPLEAAGQDIVGRTPTMREVLAKHRADPNCSSCHNRMDPLGLALENFNALGTWRDKDMQQPVDATGKLSTGEAFKDIRELKKILLTNHREEFYRCLTQKLLTYALGRGVEYYDTPTVDQIVDNMNKDGGKFSALLMGVIDSVAFQQQRLQPDAPPAQAAPLLSQNTTRPSTIRATTEALPPNVITAWVAASFCAGSACASRCRPWNRCSPAASWLRLPVPRARSEPEEPRPRRPARRCAWRFSRSPTAVSPLNGSRPAPAGITS